MTARTGFCFLMVSIFCLVISTDGHAGIKSLRPSEACSLLDSHGLPTLGWKTYYDDECGCSSRSKPLGPGNPFKNQLAYDVEGTGQTVKQIRLIVNVLNPEAADIAHAEFQKTAVFLITKLTANPVSEKIARAIAAGGNHTFLADGYLFEILRREWTMNSDSGSRQCHEIKLVIR